MNFQISYLIKRDQSWNHMKYRQVILDELESLYSYVYAYIYVTIIIKIMPSIWKEVTKHGRSWTEGTETELDRGKGSNIIIF